MNLWNKIFLGLIVVVSLAFFYFGARALSIHQFWGERLVKVVGKDGKGGEIQRLAEEKQKALDAIRSLEGDLRKLTAARGRVWVDCQPQRGKLDPETCGVSVLVPSKDPVQQQTAPVDSEVFIFQDAVYDAQGKLAVPCVYLGEFSVKKIDKNQWDVLPSRGMTEAGLRKQKVDRLQETQRRLQRNEATTWTIYQVLPKENIFEIAAHLPPEAPAPGAKPPEDHPADGARPPAQPQPGPGPQGDQAAANWEKLVARFAEQLWDYEIVFNDFYRQLKAREDAIARASQELKTLKEDQDAASGLVTSFKQQEQATTGALKAQQAERQATEDLAKRLDAVQRTLQAGIGETLNTNQDLAAEIARLQLEALRRIRQQTGDVAQVPGAR
jgi:hypothetical protein